MKSDPLDFRLVPRSQTRAYPVYMTLLRLPAQPTGELVQSPAPLGGQSVRFVVGDYLVFGCIYEVIRASVCTALLRNPRRIQVAPSTAKSIT